MSSNEILNLLDRLLELRKGLQTKWGAVEESMAQFHLSGWLWVGWGKQRCAYHEAPNSLKELLPAKQGGQLGDVQMGTLESVHPQAVHT